MLEQPKNSLFEMHPMIQSVFSLAKCYRKSIHMRDFGGLTAKPTWLYSGHVFPLNSLPYQSYSNRNPRSPCVLVWIVCLLCSVFQHFV